MQVMANLNTKTQTGELPMSIPSTDSPHLPLQAEPSSSGNTAVGQACASQRPDTTGSNDIAVHKFPVDKQLLLQMRFRQMHGRQSAALVTTPAKALPLSGGGGIISPSHVGPSRPASTHTQQDYVHSEKQLQMVPTATDFDSFAIKDGALISQYTASPLREAMPHNGPHFKDLHHHHHDTAAAQQAEMNLIQHSMSEPAICLQCPDSPPSQLPIPERRPIPMQSTHEQHQAHPSYAWSTQQLTAIAAAAATAAAAAFQQEAYAKQTALSVAVDAAKSAEQAQVAMGLTEPTVIASMPAAAVASKTSQVHNAQDAEAMPEAAVVAHGIHAVERTSTPKAPAVLSSSYKDQPRQLNERKQIEARQAEPKQSAALRKLKHRSSASRGLGSHTKVASAEQGKTGSADVHELTNADKPAAAECGNSSNSVHQVCACISHLQHFCSQRPA